MCRYPDRLSAVRGASPTTPGRTSPGCSAPTSLGRCTQTTTAAASAATCGGSRCRCISRLQTHCRATPSDSRDGHRSVPTIRPRLRHVALLTQSLHVAPVQRRTAIGHAHHVVGIRRGSCAATHVRACAARALAYRLLTPHLIREVPPRARSVERLERVALRATPMLLAAGSELSLALADPASPGAPATWSPRHQSPCVGRYLSRISSSRSVNDELISALPVSKTSR